MARFNEICQNINYLNHIETPCVHYYYKVKTNVLRPKHNRFVLDDAAHHKCLMGGEDISVYAGSLTRAESVIQRSNKLKDVSPSNVTFETYSKETIEYSGSVTIPYK